ncbi:uncharacterized protein M437DRAFT_62632 [Aureobasidium melanogenum CBS 110374]|uniref:Uncharacterized protein n=1 Tax=Aureobasidium melanogenum (strain CBS 110374) TaxID=1043003 RepID=A0A074W025_AURM1|nr:uncharacterized protein M437DRAFT_62632 [Aureobasidium melanogenum CBS 110374]KEQ66430.1 hypothetical protein M437DRAFT_62632 [Aureobasidium melanogenum CBS 110374]
MVCENHRCAISPYGSPPAYENVVSPTYEGAEPPPTYSQALFDALGERIARLREQLDARDEDWIPQSRENLDSWTACTTAFVRARRQERETLEPSVRERLARGTTSTGRILPPELWSIDELLHRARLRPTPRQQTRSTPREQTTRPPRENLPTPPQPVIRMSPREDTSPPLRPKRDLMVPARPQVELPSSLQTRPISQE